MTGPEIVQVAVYGEMREGMPEHAALEGVKRLGKGRISGFQLFSVQGQAIAIPVKGSTIVAEVWQAPMHTIEKMIENSPALAGFAEVPTPWGCAKIPLGHVTSQAVPITTGDWRDFNPAITQRTGTHS